MLEKRLTESYAKIGEDNKPTGEYALTWVTNANPDEMYLLRVRTDLSDPSASGFVAPLDKGDEQLTIGDVMKKYVLGATESAMEAMDSDNSKAIKNIKSFIEEVRNDPNSQLLTKVEFVSPKVSWDASVIDNSRLYVNEIYEMGEGNRTPIMNTQGDLDLKNTGWTKKDIYQINMLHLVLGKDNKGG